MVCGNVFEPTLRFLGGSFSVLYLLRDRLSKRGVRGLGWPGLPPFGGSRLNGRRGISFSQISGWSICGRRAICEQWRQRSPKAVSKVFL